MPSDRTARRTTQSPRPGTTNGPRPTARYVNSTAEQVSGKWLTPIAARYSCTLTIRRNLSLRPAIQQLVSAAPIPTLREKKGAATSQSVNATNQLQIGLGLFSPASLPSDAGHTPPPGEWLLLYFYDGQNQELRSEFSRPAALSEDGEVEAWDVRVILEPTYPDFAMVQPSLFGTEDDDIDFAISRANGN